MICDKEIEWARITALQAERVLPKEWLVAPAKASWSEFL